MYLFFGYLFLVVIWWVFLFLGWVASAISDESYLEEYNAEQVKKGKKKKGRGKK